MRAAPAHRAVGRLAGPDSRAILSAVTETPLDNRSFRWLSARTGAVAGIGDVRLLRVTYTGELGWELHVPMAGMRTVHDALVEAGSAGGLVHVGSAALNALRMEKAYKSGHEITNEVTLAEADLGRFARRHGFQGAEPSLAPPKRWRIALLRLAEGPAVAADPPDSEAVLRGSEVVGGFGYAVGAFLAWAYLRPDCAAAGSRLDVLVLGQRREAEIIEGAPVDPTNTRPRRDVAAAE